MKMLRNNFLLVGAAFLLLIHGCVDDPDPAIGFNESFYISLKLGDQLIRVEDDDPELQYGLQPGSGNNFINVFESNGPYDVECTLYMGFDPTKQDIEDLEGKNIPIDDYDGAPWIRIFLIDNVTGGGFTTGVDPIDYGPSNFVIDEVIKGPKIKYNEPLSGDERQGRSYVLRGTFDFNITKSSWSASEPVVFIPVTEGEFSIRVFVP